MEHFMKKITPNKMRRKNREGEDGAISHSNRPEQSRWHAAITSDASRQGESLSNCADDSGRSSDAGGDYRSDDYPTENKPALARRETRAVTRLKLIVMMVLLCSAIGTATLTYFYIRNSEAAQFQQGYENSAHKVVETIRKSLMRTLVSLDNLAVSTVSHARSTNQPWPTVTVPDFAIRAAKMMSLCDAVFVALLPRVTSDTRQEWESYAATHDQWLNASVHLQANYDLFHGPIEYSTGHVDDIWGDFGDIESSVDRDLLPQWQNFPVINDDGYPAYNYDWFSETNIDAVSTALYQHRVVISEAYLLPDPLDPVAVAETEIWTEWLSSFVQPGEPYDEPASDLHFPLFDQLDAIRAPSSLVVPDDDKEKYDPSKHSVVGTLTATLFWRDLIKDILPSGNDGTVVVFENPCNPTFTYQINGPSAVFLGRGDLHDPAYDDMEITSNFFKLDITTMLYTGPPIDTEFCPFRLRIYPSDDMRDTYTSQDPIIFMVLAISIFVFTSAIFLLYDCHVERRQRLILNTAERSSAIVSSLFPEQVQERLADAVVGARDINSNNKRRSSIKNSIKLRQSKKQTFSNLRGLSADQISQSRIDAFLQADGRGGDSQSILIDSAPIASLYPDTTVMFADIAGFTQWSSKREPADVFTLLETLYGHFDAIAKRRKVFKVETIGDCYVAVTGLPATEPRHAIIMAKFAMDCRNKMQEVTRELKATLGPDTSLLALRVGLHSGPTTAGVLRGAKARFQLFGDTVNTAARMESNGLPNKIHVSQSMADLLMGAGKELWLTKREEMIEAKGKGKMQTWWVDPTSSCRAGSTFSGSVASSIDDLEEEGLDTQGLDDAVADLEALKYLDSMIASKSLYTGVSE